MHLGHNDAVSADDVLYHLSTSAHVGSAAPSALGHQLERLRAEELNVTPKEKANAPWMAKPKRQRGSASTVSDHKAEEILRRAALDRCTSGFRMQAKVVSRLDLAALRDFASLIEMPEGEVAIRILTTYQAWATHSQERALAAVYTWMQTVAATLPDAAGVGPDDSLAQAFREGRGKRARSKAAELWADARLALDAWLAAWNNRRPDLKLIQGGRHAARQF